MSNIIKVYQAMSSNGYRDSPMGIYRDSAKAGEVTKNNWGSEPRDRYAIESGGKFYLLESYHPIDFKDDEVDRKKIKKAALKKLTPLERQVLGLDD